MENFTPRNERWFLDLDMARVKSTINLLRTIVEKGGRRRHVGTRLDLVFVTPHTIGPTEIIHHLSYEIGWYEDS